MTRWLSAEAYRSINLTSKDSDSNISCEFGECCTGEGQFFSFSMNKVCRIPLDDCKRQTTCDGSSQYCPEVPKSNGISCAGTSSVCEDGICKGSVCTEHGFLECFREDVCEICCKIAVNESCLPASDFGLRTRDERTYLKKVGELCVNGHGYCNEEGRCVYFLTAPLSQRITSDVIFEINVWLMQNWMLTVAIALLILYLIKVRLFPKVKDDSVLLQHFFMEVRKTRHILGFFPKAQEASRYMEDGIVQLSRLVAMFPTVSLEIHGDCVRQVGVEEEIVKMFLHNGIPIRQEFIEKIAYPKLRRGIIISPKRPTPPSKAGPSGVRAPDQSKSSSKEVSEESSSEMTAVSETEAESEED